MRLESKRASCNWRGGPIGRTYVVTLSSILVFAPEKGLLEASGHVPLRQLLVTVHNVDRIVDVQYHRLGRLPVASAPDVDECVGEADDFPQRCAFSQREMVGCEQRSLPVAGVRAPA